MKAGDLPGGKSVTLISSVTSWAMLDIISGWWGAAEEKVAASTLAIMRRRCRQLTTGMLIHLVKASRGLTTILPPTKLLKIFWNGTCHCYHFYGPTRIKHRIEIQMYMNKDNRNSVLSKYVSYIILILKSTEWNFLFVSRLLYSIKIFAFKRC